MTTTPHLPVEFPAQPKASENLCQANPITGPFTVTATLDSLDGMIEWLEGRCQFDYGYYRFIDSPLLCRIQEGLQNHCQVRHSLVYSSYQAATLELLDYLLLSKPQMTLKVISDFSERSPFYMVSSLETLSTNISLTTPDNISALQPFSKERNELLLLNLQDPLAFAENHEAFLKEAKASRVPVIVASDCPSGPWPTRLIGYWTFPLSTSQQKIRGGAIVSNVDRQMAELVELRKQRGPILSSRNASYLLGESQAPEQDHQADLIQRFCQLEHAQHGFLFSSGMQAITTLFSLLRKPGKAQMIVVGHLYTDTYAQLTYGKQRTGKVENIFLEVNELGQLEEMINEETAAIITETITNPLNDVPDIEIIAQVARKHQIPTIVDNTLATPMASNPLDYGVDFVVHATTKYFNGKNDHGGGAILTNNQQMANAIEQHQKHWKNQLSPLESAVLWERVQDFEERMARFQANALKMTQFLEQHPQVEQLFSHKTASHRSHEVSNRLITGTCSVMSFTLKEPGLDALRRFYDSPLEHILKAPSLGSDQTILCPYTMLAHYHESDEILEELGLSRQLIRISVGCETDIQPVMESLDLALR